MANLLELSQLVAFRSKTVPGQNQPAAVTGLPGRLAAVVDWTRWGWREIQTHRPNWRWMRREFEGAALANTQYFEPADWGAERFGSWCFDPRPRHDTGWTIELTSEGRPDERPLVYVPYDHFRTLLRGDRHADYPQIFTVDPRERVGLYPTPEADYTVRGEFFRGPQPLTLGTDVPEMPERFHDLIVLKALVLLAESDEDAYHDPRWRNRAQTLMAELEQSQLPLITMGGPLA